MVIDKIGISTASYCLWGIEPSLKLEISRRLHFDRIEIGLSTVKMANEFTADKKLLNQLKEFTHITVFAPWCRMNYANNSKTKKVLQLFLNISDSIPVEAFVFNIDCVSDIETLENSNLNIYLENSEKPGSWQVKGIIKEFTL